MRRGDIFMVSLDPTAGREQRGHRPVLVISADAFNTATGLPVVLPITSGGGFARRLGFAVSLSGKVTGIVRCDQPRTLDIAARGGKWAETLPQPVVDEVLGKVAAIFE